MARAIATESDSESGKPVSRPVSTLSGAMAPLAYLALFGFGWLVLSHFFPPFSPADSAQQMADQFLARRVPILLGGVAMLMATMLLMPYGAILVLIVRKAEDGIGMLTVMMTFTQVTYMVMNFFVPFGFILATFRADRDPGLIQFAGDFGFIQFIGGISMFWMIWVVTAIASFKTLPGGGHVLPRWYGYFNIWCAVLYVPELLIFFFNTGPFAWDGIVGFWIPAAVFIAYFLVTPFAFVQVLRRHAIVPA